MLDMYKGMVNSPETTITNDINAEDTIIYVLDETKVPEELPNLMTLGTGTSAETVKVLEVNGNALTVERGFQGVPRSWNAGTVIARNFTEYDYNALKENIETLDKEIGNLDSLSTEEKSNLVGAINEVCDDLVAHKAENATTSAKGHVQLSDSTSSASTSLAATANAVRVAYNKAVEALNKANEAFQSASDGKNLIATAITGKGIPASGSDTFSQLASKILSISGKYATGTVSVSDGVYTITGLAFTPVFCVLINESFSSSRQQVIVIDKNKELGGPADVWFRDGSLRTNDFTYIEDAETLTYISQTSFYEQVAVKATVNTVTYYSDGLSFNANSVMGTFTPYTLKYIAIGEW